MVATRTRPLQRAPMGTPATVRSTGDAATDEQVDKLATKQADSIAQEKVSHVVTFGATAVRIEHGLGAVPTGWSVVRLNAASTIYESKDPDSACLWLIASAACRATIEVW